MRTVNVITAGRNPSMNEMFADLKEEDDDESLDEKHDRGGGNGEGDEDDDDDVRLQK